MGGDLERASASTFPVGTVTPWCLVRQRLSEKAIVTWRTCSMFLSHLLFVISAPCARDDDPRTQLIRAWHRARRCHFYCHSRSDLGSKTCPFPCGRFQITGRMRWERDPPVKLQLALERMRREMPALQANLPVCWHLGTLLFPQISCFPLILMGGRHNLAVFHVGRKKFLIYLGKHLTRAMCNVM